MSKIAEKKALEAYPMVNPPYSNSDEPKLNVENSYKREGYIKGYDQAMQDLLKDAINGIMDCGDDSEWIEITDKLIVTPSRAGKKVKIIIIETEQQ